MRKVLAISYEVNTRQLNYRERAKYLLPVNSLPYLKLIIENWWIVNTKKINFNYLLWVFFIYLAKEIKCFFFVKEYNIKNNTKIRPRLYFIQPIRWLIRLITRWKMSCYRKKNLSLKKKQKITHECIVGKACWAGKVTLFFVFCFIFLNHFSFRHILFWVFFNFFLYRVPVHEHYLKILSNLLTK